MINGGVTVATLSIRKPAWKFLVRDVFALAARERKRKSKRKILAKRKKKVKKNRECRTSGASVYVAAMVRSLEQ